MLKMVGRPSGTKLVFAHLFVKFVPFLMCYWLKTHSVVSFSRVFLSEQNRITDGVPALDRPPGGRQRLSRKQ
jgi:hypothetical protein